jgi:hypothetical protein
MPSYSPPSPNPIWGWEQAVLTHRSLTMRRLMGSRDPNEIADRNDDPYPSMLVGGGTIRRGETPNANVFGFSPLETKVKPHFTPS